MSQDSRRESQVAEDEPATRSSVPFPTPGSEHPPSVPESGSSSSNLTSSDKLSALPGIQSSPALGRLMQSHRPTRRSLDASTSLTSIESASPGITGLSRLPSRASDSGSSAQGRDTPRARVSFDSDRHSLPAALLALRPGPSNRPSPRPEVAIASPSIRSGESSRANSQPAPQPTPRKEGTRTPNSPSPSQSRAASPLRFFGWNLHRAHSRDEPFIPVDPFQLRLRFFASPSTTPQRPTLELVEAQCADACGTCLPVPAVSKARLRTCGSGTRHFFVDTLPRQMYLHILFRLPALYFSRVARLFEDAEVSKHEVQRMIAACAPPQPNPVANGVGVNAGFSAAFGGVHNAALRNHGSLFPFPEDWNPPSVSPALARFKNSWEQFIDSLMREWKTLNLVSVLLCTTVLTMFQIPDAAGDPLTRWSALLSLIFSIMSLTYGCIYIVQFNSMRSMYKASRWAEEAQKTKTMIWWNVWVLLAMPAIWLAWAMTAFCVAVLSYIWRTGDTDDPGDGVRPQLSPRAAAAVRTVLTVVFGVGVVYFVLIIRTFASYGEREAGWRRSWLATGNGERRYEGERERGRRRNRDRDRGRRSAQASTRELSPEPEEKRSPVLGLGLLGVSSGQNGLASLSSVLAEDSGPAQGSRDSIPMENMRGKGRISPKL